MSVPLLGVGRRRQSLALPYGYATNGLGPNWAVAWEDTCQTFDTSKWGGGFPASATPYNSGFYRYDYTKSVSSGPPPVRPDNSVQIPAPPAGGPNVLSLKTFLQSGIWYSAQLATYAQVLNVTNFKESLVYLSGAPTNSGTAGSHYPIFGWTTIWSSIGNGSGELDDLENDPVAGGQLITTYHVGDGTGHGVVIPSFASYANKWTRVGVLYAPTAVTLYMDGVEVLSIPYGPESSPAGSNPPDYGQYLLMTTGITTSSADLVPYTHCIGYVRIWSRT